MRQVESKFTQYPTALELPDLPSERQMARAEELREWVLNLGLRYNTDYVCFEFTEGKPGYRQKTCMAWAFKKRALALQFKLMFAGFK